MDLRRLAPLVSMAGALVARAPHARAQSASGVRLSWVRLPGAEGCADASVLAQAVTRHLQRDPFHHPAAQHIEAVVDRDAGRWRARVFLRSGADGATEVREFTDAGDVCAPVERAVALAIAVAIDPDAAFRGPAPDPVPAAAPAESAEPAPTAPPAPALAPVAAPAPPRTRRPRHRRASTTSRTVHLAASARGGVALGIVPSPALSMALGVDLRGRAPWSAGAAVRFVPEMRGAGDASGFAFGFTGASLSGCYEPLRLPRFLGAVCTSIHLGGVHAVVFERTPLEPGQRVWFAAAGSLRGEVPLVGPLALSLEATLLAPLVRYRFAIEGSDSTVFAQPPVAGLLEAGLSLHFR